MFSWKESGNIRYLEINEFIEKGVKAFFSTRIGGISIGNYKGLNLGLHTKDDHINVLKNRELFCNAIGINYCNVVAGEQVHGDKVKYIKPCNLGMGALDYRNSIGGIDALITNYRNIPLISFYADCVPLYFFDPVKKVIGLAHSGWKGTVLKIGIKTLETMSQLFESRVSDCLVGIGPSISKDNYEVDERVFNKFRASFINWRELFVSKGKGRYYLDISLANQLLFKEFGIPEKQLIVSKYCTFKNNNLFYSYRREKGNTGRMASIIAL